MYFIAEKPALRKFCKSNELRKLIQTEAKVLWGIRNFLIQRVFVDRLTAACFLLFSSI